MRLPDGIIQQGIRGSSIRDSCPTDLCQCAFGQLTANAPYDLFHESDSGLQTAALDRQESISYLYLNAIEAVVPVRSPHRCLLFH